MVPDASLYTLENSVLVLHIHTTYYIHSLPMIELILFPGQSSGGGVEGPGDQPHGGRGEEVGPINLLGE